MLDTFEKELDYIDIHTSAPEQEPKRQYWFMKKAKMLVEEKSRELGRPLTACITTFGCQMNFVCETA